MSDQSNKQLKNINVFVRVRPLENSITEDISCVNIVSKTELSIKSREQIQKNCFTFDRIFHPQTEQHTIYNTVAKEIVNKSFEGINGTIFCYGQTSSGKTYTCIGPELADQNKRGILPRIMQQILIRMEKRPKNIESNMKVAMIEIYNQKIIDLLSEERKYLKIRSNKTQGIFLPGVTEKYILTLEQALFYTVKGISNRSIGSTFMNKISSRSHMMFLVTLSEHDLFTGEARSAKITLADLAGSEKLSKSGAEGKSLQETKKINTSLSTLGKVIHLLSEGKSSHIPYRDSKLTRLLQESLGGNSITNLIINISPSFINEVETLTSLRFGFRAKQIKNSPRVNKSYTVSELLQLLNKAQKKIKDQNELILELRKGHRPIDEVSSFSAIVKEEEESYYEEMKKIPSNLNFMTQEDSQFQYNINQSTQSLQQWEERDNLSPLIASYSPKRCLDHKNLSPTYKDLKVSLDLKPKFSLRDITVHQNEGQSLWQKSMEIESKVYSLELVPQSQNRSQKQKTVSSKVNSEKEKNEKIENNLKQIKQNLELIKEKHVRLKRSLKKGEYSQI